MAQSKDNIVNTMAIAELLFAAGVVWYLIWLNSRDCGCHHANGGSSSPNMYPGGTMPNLQAPGGVVKNPTYPGYPRSVAEASGMYGGSPSNTVPINYTTGGQSSVGGRRYNREGYGYSL